MPIMNLAQALTLVFGLLPALAHAIRHFDIFNNCPMSLNVVINGRVEGLLFSQESTTRDFPDNWSGLIYTDLNQGNVDGAGTIRAGFEGSNSYYYIVKDPKWLNVGLRIETINGIPRQGYCPSVECRVDGDCSNAFTSPPTSFPVPGSTAPTPPLHRCPQSSPDTVGYRVTFCPDGTLPNYQTGARNIQPQRAVVPTILNKCLDVRGGQLANGSPVQIYDCNGTGAQKWAIKRGGQNILLSGTGYCLDGGSHPASGTKMKIWQCYDNLPAQRWVYTSDDTIVLNGTNQCLDLTDGSLANGNQVQTWECGAGNLNQVWIA